MFTRLLPTLLSLCLLATYNGFGLHVHWHSHGNDRAHSHVVSNLDADYTLAHVQGSQDDDSSQIGKFRNRAGPELPQLGPVSPALVQIQPERAPTLLPLLTEQRVTGPPGHFQPPSQAPPHTLLVS